MGRWVMDSDGDRICKLCEYYEGDCACDEDD